jgi:hypothetical protein
MKVVVKLFRFEGQRHVEFALYAVGGSRGEHANDDVWNAIHAELLTDDVAVRTEAVLPEAIGKNDLVISANFSFLGQEVPAKEKGLTQNLEEARSRWFRPYLLRLTGDGQAHLAAGPSSHRLKGNALAFPIEVVGSGADVALAIYFGPNHDDAVRLPVREGSEQGGIDDAEDRGVRADTQG